MRKQGLFIIATLLFVASALGAPLLAEKVSALSASDWQAGRIIDDSVFTDSNSMSVVQIQNFLNAQVPNCDTNGTQPATDWGRSDLTHAQYATQVKGWPGPPYVCLKDYYEVPKTTPGAGVPDNSYNHYDATNKVLLPVPNGVSAAQLIYNAAQQYHINPKVLLIKIRSESAGPLTNDTWPLATQYTYAMGAHCPDSGPNHSANCDPNYAGFSIQISEAAALLRYYLDNMSQPWWPYKKLGDNTIQYNPDPSCGSSTVNILTSATAALYTYTPYQPNAGALAAGLGTAPCGAYGNRNFWIYFNEWWGSSLSDTYYSCHGSSNVSGSPTGERVVRNHLNGAKADNLSLVIPNNTGTACTEIHTWADSNYSAWLQHTATNSPAIDPTVSDIISANLDGVGSRLYEVNYTGTNSGMVEVHGWDATELHWVSHIATNRPAINPADARVIAADTNGDGKDELYLVQYRNTGSGMVEIHGWAPGLQQWTSHIATNMPAVDPAQGKIIAADTNGDGRDEFVYVKTGGSQSGTVEIHIWAPGEQAWVAHIASILPSAGYDPTANDIIAIDTNGDGRDELLYVKYSGTQSGRLEVHGFTPNFQQWASHIATSSGSF